MEAMLYSNTRGDFRINFIWPECKFLPNKCHISGFIPGHGRLELFFTVVISELEQRKQGDVLSDLWHHLCTIISTTIPGRSEYYFILQFKQLIFRAVRWLAESYHAKIWSWLSLEPGSLHSSTLWLVRLSSKIVVGVAGDMAQNMWKWLRWLGFTQGGLKFLVPLLYWDLEWGHASLTSEKFPFAFVWAQWQMTGSLSFASLLELCLRCCISLKL